MIICKSSDATGLRNLKQSKEQATVEFEVKIEVKGVSDLHDLRLGGPWKSKSCSYTRKGKDKPLMA